MSSSSPSYIYADNAATTPLAPNAFEAMLPYLKDKYGNPSGIYGIARSNAQAMNEMRSSIANMLGATSPNEIYLTSGGTESDNWVLRGRIEHLRKTLPPEQPIYIVTSAIEHHAILNTCKALEAYNVRTVLINPDSEGFITPNALEAALSKHDGDTVAIVSIMYANNEIGTIQNIKTLAEVAHRHGIPFHSDAVQAVGHIDVNVNELDVDALSLSAHKFNGPRGIGALYLKTTLEVEPLITGGGQEHGMRSGTENMAGIAGMEAALKAAQTSDCIERRRTLATLRDRLVHQVLNQTNDVVLTGTDAAGKRLPGNASFCCKDVDGELLTVILDKEGVAASTGSACNTGSTKPSHVITAIGITDLHWNKGTLRLTLSEDMAEIEIEELAQRTIRAIKKTRMISGMDSDF